MSRLTAPSNSSKWRRTMTEILRIVADFERVNEREDLRAWRTRGVYINLGGNPVNTARVGEGWVDARAAAAWRRRDERVIACDLGRLQSAKRDAQIVEWLLLEEYRFRMGRLPRRNHQSGKLSIVDRCLARRGRIRVRIKGRNPLNGRSIASSVHVEIDRDDEGCVWSWG
jgi:hypothetical protein